MQQFRPSPYDIEHYPEMDRSGVVPFQAIARALKGADEGSGPRTTALFIANPNMISSTATLYLSNAGGIAYTANYTLPSNGGTLIDLADVVGLSDGIYSAVANGSQPLMLGSYTYHSNAAVYPVGDYETPIALSVRLPYVARTDAAHTVFSLQNLGAAVATITVSYYTNAGVSVYDQVVSNLAPGQAQRFDHRQMTDLPDSFTGYAIATANGQPIQGIVDEYLVPLCYPVSSAHIDQMPTNPIYTLTPVTFTAAATGTLPFSYTWTLDGAPLGGNQNLLEHTFTAPGNYTIGVTVTNACGAAQAEQSITVQPLPPDLSASHKLVSLAQVTNGDVLTYTLMLHNSNASPATAVITDPLPAHTTYIPDSVWASSGVITFTAGEMRWYGPIISGTPVLLQFAAQLNAAGLTPGDIVTNTAQLDDGLGNVSTLRASSIFNPGYRLAIDDGALYTNIPTVTLALSWASEVPPITQMDISNDGGFSAGTGWIAISSSYAPWMLTTYGALTLPRVAYARFRDGNGQIYGPVQDDIIYDPIAPQVAQVTIITQTQVLRATGHQSVIVRVASSDDNSGVSEIEISDHADLATGQSFPATGATTDVVWSLQPSGWVYVRAIDRAGNVSAISAARLPTDFKVYLPTLFRQFP